MSVFSDADATADANTATTPSHRATLTGESTVWGFTTPVADKAAATCFAAETACAASSWSDTPAMLGNASSNGSSSASRHGPSSSVATMRHRGTNECRARRELHSIAVFMAPTVMNKTRRQSNCPYGNL